MPEAVIAAAARTPIGRAKKGSLVDVRSDDLGAFVVRKVLEQVPQLDPGDVDDVVMGIATQFGEQGVNIARDMALLGGLPDSVPGTTVARQCASSLQSIRMAFHAIRAGEGDAFVAGGMDSASRTAGAAGPAPEPNPRFLDPSRDDYAGIRYVHVGITAENVAERWGISRERQDEFAKLSQDRAVAAQRNGRFALEICPYTRPDGVVVTDDDGPRPNTTLEKLAELKPVFKEGGTVTAGNSCPTNDGAAAVLVLSDAKAAELGVPAQARIVATAVAGVPPDIMGVGPIEAVPKLLAATGLTIDDIDVVELNEAFASQVLACVDELGISIEDQLNPHGGAIALGHPPGMTGARLVGSLLHSLRERDGTFGMATMCIGGGMGMALLVERLS
jgi:acetyl-CoA C-acetyltransferase